MAQLGFEANFNVVKALVAGAAAATTVDALTVPTATTKGVKRGARFHYRSSTRAAVGGLSDGVFLEIGSRGGAMPTSTMSIRSLIAEHDSSRIGDVPEADTFEVRVLRPARTLVEKLVLLHTATCDPNPAALVRGARHYYDIHQLLQRREVRDEINEVGITILARDVLTYSTAAALPAQPRPLGGFADSAAFTPGSHLDFVQADYQSRVLGALLWPRAARPSFDACLAAVGALRHVL